MNNQLLTLLQIGDSNFPSGAFSHSFGLETYIQDGTVHNQETFFHWLRIYLEKQLVYTDGLAFRLTFDHLADNHLTEIWQLDQTLYVQNLPIETRQANRRIGERFIKMGIDLYSIPLLEQYLAKIREGEAYGHPAIVFAMISDDLKIDRDEAMVTFLYSTITSLVQNGVRGIPLGQTAGQRMLVEIQPYVWKAMERIKCLEREDFGAVAPGLEIAQMRHERLHVRLFMS
ncbi:urease accessory protein UreF [Neobacillus jeddahensis]|uniref:urease accessory protein UreF n=1 Tax=Neobacillus jeddahensis TaxID=1461580 RepID=UPI00058D3FFB|nr:urease accessory protein UreF [Neobacillus jeddahensis]